MFQKTTVFSALTAILVIFYYPIVFGGSEESNTLVFQGKTFTAILEDDSLKNVLEKFQKETGIWFKAPESELNERVSVQFANLSIQEGLKRILRTMNYSFLFDQSNNLMGAFIFGKVNRIKKATYPSDINEKMVKAAMEGDTAAVVESLAKGADVNAKGRYSGWTPLILAAKRGETELVNFLLSYGADVNEKSDVRNRTAIMEAARNRKVEVWAGYPIAHPYPGLPADHVQEKRRLVPRKRIVHWFRRFEGCGPVAGAVRGALRLRSQSAAHGRCGQLCKNAPVL